MAGFASQVKSVTWYSEQTLKMQCDDLILQGTLDLRSAEGAIEDYKVTSAWSFVFGKPEWEQQLNVYALLCEANGIPVKSLTINAFLRDWSERNFQQYKPDYPSRPFYQTTLPLWPLEKRKKFVIDRLADHKAGMRPCTPEERWQKESSWAVVKAGQKRALRVLPSEDEAKKWMSEYPDKKSSSVSIQYRPGACTRCDKYCMVRSVCPYRGSACLT